MKKIFFTLLSICLFSSVVMAQTDTTKKIKESIATFLSGVIYAPELHYYGRTDSLKSSAVLPTVYIQFDSIGIYISATSVFLNDKTQTMTYAGTITEAGYKFGHKIKGFGGSIYANKFFYNTTQLPQSALQEQAGINLYYLTKYINFTASASAAFSNKTDGFVGLGINHTFKKVKGKNIFLAIPTFIANAGSQNFTTAKNTSGTILTPSQEETSNSSRFNMLDYELSMPLIYARNHLYVIVTPSYILPVNVISVPGHPELSETAKNLFYANVTVLYSVKWFKK
ncbi:MAG TPA: hypothetical protein VK718_05410 [Ferruginibacter sp.]|jgi:hypothetical protein|nr:hypothetical protein [Ferruginibacter sp.]